MSIPLFSARLVSLSSRRWLLLLSVLCFPAVFAVAGNPPPFTRFIAPLVIPAGATTPVTVSGANFLPSSVALIGGVKTASTYESATSLVVHVPIATGFRGQVELQVENPAPGGGLSQTLTIWVASPISLTKATRILDETTFGPTLDLINHVEGEGLDAWIEEQFNTPATILPLTPYGLVPNLPAECPSSSFCIKTFWWNAALNGPDQLRQRVAFALSQIFVISDSSLHGVPISPYSNMLANDAFTNWYQIMTDVTLSAGMGDYLNMTNSAKAPPGEIANENFARENMQLFNMGLYMLNQDGTQQTDHTGAPIPSYTEDQVEAFARAYTGWTYANRDGSAPIAFNVAYNYNQPLAAVENQHDDGEEILLDGAVLPAGQTAQKDLAAALTNTFNNANVPPFVSRQLIQKLVTGDPSPAYVARVAKTFTDNGQGIRGDMRSVIRAILIDPEARAGDYATPAENFGHLRDPLTWTTHLLRGVGFTNTDPDGYYVGLWFALVSLGDADYDANSVFNFFPPDYFVPGTTLNEPEFDLESTGAIGQRRSLGDSLLTNKVPGIRIDLGPGSPLVTLAANPTNLVTTLNNLFAHGRMDPKIQAAVIDEITKSTDPAQRARLAIYLITTAPANKIEN